jgi:hypothetical protein
MTSTPEIAGPEIHREGWACLPGRITPLRGKGRVLVENHECWVLALSDFKHAAEYSTAPRAICTGFQFTG